MDPLEGWLGGGSSNPLGGFRGPSGTAHKLVIHRTVRVGKDVGNLKVGSLDESCRVQDVL